MFLVRRVFRQNTSWCMCRNFAKYAKREDPGIARQKQLLSLDENEETVDFEDFESDFMQVDKSHREHMQEMELLSEKEKYHIVRQKYFKQKFPNFLTWHDKEQIRYLHKSDPEEWTIEWLAEGFPALPNVVKQIVKGNWTKSTQSKVTNHDASVQSNWKLFKEGQMVGLPKDLAEHLNKFTNRALNLKPFVLPDIPKTVIKAKKNTSTEFSDIIKSYQKLKNIQHDNIEIKADVSNKPPGGDTYMVTSLKKRKPVTLNQLQHELMEKAELGKNVEEDEKHIIMNLKEKEQNAGEDEQNLIDLSTNKYETSTGLQSLKKTDKDFSHLNYPERISIPKAILKKGLVYKLNDCYYDDDGEFLYRVPGMG